MKMFRVKIFFILLVIFLILTCALASTCADVAGNYSGHQLSDEVIGPNVDAYGWTNGFYETYAKLESSFGSYDKWPSSAKEELFPFFSANSTEQLDSILAEKYGDGRIDMITLYSVIVGDYNAVPIFWDEESRLQYSDLLLKYNLAYGGWIDVTRPNDIITPDEAIKQSQEYICSLGLASLEEIDQLKYYWSYGCTGEQKNACYEIYIFSDDDNLLKSCYVFSDLTVSENVEKDAASENIWVDEEVIRMIQDYASSHEDIPDNASFAGWPLYAKEYFSLHIAPIIRQKSYGRKDIYSPVELLAAAQYEYGMPNDKSISMETAKEIANQELIDSYHLEAEKIKEMDVCIYYDITDEANPIWKFLFSYQNDEMETDKNMIFKIHVSAYDAIVAFSDSWNYRKDAYTWENLMPRY